MRAIAGKFGSKGWAALTPTELDVVRLRAVETGVAHLERNGIEHVPPLVVAVGELGHRKRLAVDGDGHVVLGHLLAVDGEVQYGQ